MKIGRKWDTAQLESKQIFFFFKHQTTTKADIALLEAIQQESKKKKESKHKGRKKQNATNGERACVCGRPSVSDFGLVKHSLTKTNGNFEAGDSLAGASR